MAISPVGDISAISNYGSSTVSPQAAAERRAVGSATRTINESGTLGENRELVFSVDPTTRRVITRVIDTQTKDILMQLPAEYILRLAEDLRKGE